MKVLAEPKPEYVARLRYHFHLLPLNQKLEDRVKVFEINILINRPYINLDHAQVEQAVPHLRDNGYLDGETAGERQSRKDEILADGSLEEV